MMKKYKSVRILWLSLILSGLIFQINAEGTREKSSKRNTQVFEYFEYEGNLDSDSVLIYCPGGPELTLHKEEFDANFLARSPLENMRDSLVVHMYQYQSKNPDIFRGQDISFEQARYYDELTTAMLAETIEYFSVQGKNVYLIGVSFGSFVVENYMAVYGTGSINGAVVCVGRLTFPDEFWQAFSRGEEMLFKDGVMIVSDGGTMGRNDGDYAARNLPRLAGGFGYKRFEELLKDVEMSHVVYIYGEKDEFVGRLTPGELQFLEGKGVKVMKSEKGHNGAAEEFVGKALLEIYAY